FKQPNALQALGAEKNGLARLKLPDAGWWRPGMDMVSHDINKQGALDIAQQRILNGGFLGDGTDRGPARLLSLAGTDIEARMMNSDQARLAPTSAPDDAAILPNTLEDASPFRGQSRAVQHVIQRVKANLAAFQCGMEAGFSDEMLLGLAQRLSTGAPIDPANPDDAPVSFGRTWDFHHGNPSGPIDYALMQQYAAQFIHHGVLAHELGHSVGQRHNFTASADAINYHDQYWVVRPQGHPAKPG